MKIIIYNKNLNPTFWDKDKKLKVEIKNALLKIAYSFFKDSKLDINIKDIYFLGSSANYNWSPTSDCDLHILVDLKELPMTSELAKEFTSLLAKKWNSEHDIFIKGHKVELYIQDVDEENRATGVYSLLQDKWIKKAMPQNIVLNKPLIKSKYYNLVNKIALALKSNDIDKIKNVMKHLTNMRESGLSSSGEFSTENIVFKILRQKNIIKKLKDAIVILQNKELSLKDGYDPTSFGPNPSATVGVSLFSSDGNHEKNYYQNQLNLMRKR
jgi:predicted nucleotidyltransferase